MAAAAEVSSSRTNTMSDMAVANSLSPPTDEPLVIDAKRDGFSSVGPDAAREGTSGEL